jgi:hypothetical protein
LSEHPVAPQPESLRGCGGLNVLDAHLHGRTDVLLSHVEETLVPSVFLDRDRIDGGIDLPPVTWRLFLRRALVCPTTFERAAYMGNHQWVKLKTIPRRCRRCRTRRRQTPSEALEMRVRVAERAHDVETEFGTAANAAAIKNAEEVIKAATLINGGASVAMLAFIGTLVSRDVLSSEQLVNITKPLLYFGCGVAASIVASAAAYLQISFSNLTPSRPMIGSLAD